MIDRRFRPLLAALLIVCACATSEAPPSSPADSPRNASAETGVSARYRTAIDAARADLRALMESQAIPGMSVAVAVEGEVVWTEGMGFADLEQSAPATPGTRYRLGSVSKLFTAAIAARLVERGVLDLDVPIQRYVPSFPEKQAPITARLLAGHLAGIRHYSNTDPVFAGKRYGSLLEGLAIFRDDPLLSVPGSAYSYTSYGYNLLGVVLEAAAGKTFEQCLRDEVTAPLGLASIALDDPAPIVPGRSAFYEKTDGSIRNAEPNDSSYKWPSGGLLGSAEDLVRFASAFAKPGFLGGPMLETTFTTQTLAGGKPTNVGLGWRIDVTEGGKRFYHHGGTITGGRAFLLVLPDEEVSVALLANFLARYDHKEALQIASRFVQAVPRERP